MKKLFTIITSIVIISSLLAQSPNKMNYQAVIRNTSGTLVANSNVGIRISILQDSLSGNVVYEETQSAVTNDNGLMTIEIGGGTMVTGTFANINWATGSYFIKTETDVAGGTNYSISAVSQLLSVPYALYASKAGNVTDNLWLKSGNNIYYNNGYLGLGTTTPTHYISIEKNGEQSDRNFISLKNTSTSESSSVTISLQAGSSNRSLSIGHWSSTYNVYPNLLNDYGYIGANGLVVLGDTIRFMSNGHSSIPPHEWMRINSVGNIGIGTTSPTSKLTISGGDININNSDNGIIMKSPNGQCWKITIDNNGNLNSNAITCP
jgi:hypothetical protein